MQRISTMTLGFVLIFFGIQLAVIDSYVLTPRVANFLSEQGVATPTVQVPQLNVNSPYQSPYSQAGYQQAPVQVVPNSIGQRKVTPPGWLCWPMLFCGTVVFLHGFSQPRN
jgi:hypothetical protein